MTWGAWLLRRSVTRKGREVSALETCGFSSSTPSKTSMGSHLVPGSLCARQLKA
jgi:hypothetical protein